MESVLIERTGDTGKKLHTGRSRNDQVALDMKLYTRDEVLATDELVKELMTTLLDLMKEHIDTYMPGFTHLQKAQPVTLAHHIGAYFEMFKRDRSRLHDIHERMNYCRWVQVRWQAQLIPWIVNIQPAFSVSQAQPSTVWILYPTETTSSEYLSACPRS